MSRWSGLNISAHIKGSKKKMTSKEENISPFLEEDQQDDEQWECDDMSESSSVSSVLSSLTGTISRSVRKPPIQGIEEEKVDDVEQGSEEQEQTASRSAKPVYPSPATSKTYSDRGIKTMVTMVSMGKGDGSRPIKASQSKRSRRFYLIWGTVLLVVIAGIVAVSVVLSTRQAPQSSSTTEDDSDANLSQREKALMEIFTTVSSEGLHEIDSPQYKAREYIMRSDTLKLTPSETVSDSRIIQRYVLAVFYYSTNGPDSWAENNWLFDDECENLYWTGISCNDEGQVRAIAFGKCRCASSRSILWNFAQLL